MASNHTVDEDLKKYRFARLKDGGYANPIAEYIWNNSQREPDTLRPDCTRYVSYICYTAYKGYSNLLNLGS